MIQSVVHFERPKSREALNVSDHFQQIFPNEQKKAGESRLFTGTRKRGAVRRRAIERP